MNMGRAWKYDGRPSVTDPDVVAREAERQRRINILNGPSGEAALKKEPLTVHEKKALAETHARLMASDRFYRNTVYSMQKDREYKKMYREGIDDNNDICNQDHAITHFLLMKSDPEYRALIKPAMKAAEEREERRQKEAAKPWWLKPMDID